MPRIRSKGKQILHDKMKKGYGRSYGYETKEESFKPWCIICGKGFESQEECEKHSEQCIANDWIRLTKENDRLKKHNAVLEAECLRLRRTLRKQNK